MAVCIVVCMIVGYLFGCIQTGYIVGRVNKIDIRDYGSGNSGTTNTLRTLGKTAAIITFLGDAVKGLVAVNLARYVIMPAFHACIRSRGRSLSLAFDRICSSTGT